jgi:hypothetical protein
MNGYTSPTSISTSSLSVVEKRTFGVLSDRTVGRRRQDMLVLDRLGLFRFRMVLGLPPQPEDSS